MAQVIRPTKWNADHYNADGVMRFIQGAQMAGSRQLTVRGLLDLHVMYYLLSMHYDVHEQSYPEKLTTISWSAE